MIATFVRFDLANLLSTRQRALAPVALAVLMVATTFSQLAPAVVVIGAIAISVMASTPFLGDERGRLDTLYALMPIRRVSVVVGRYCTLLVLYVAVEIVATALALVVPALRGQAIDVGVLVTLHEVSLVAVALLLSVQLPCFFALGFTPARVMAWIPLVAIAALVWGADRLGLIHTPRVYGAPDPLGIVLAVAIAVVLLAISAAVSVRLYARRAL